MKAKLLFRKSLHQLDRGMYAQARENLEQAIAVAREEHDHVTLAGALCCLGDYLGRVGETEGAKTLLQEVLSFQFEEERFAYERSRARELLSQMDIC
jgi:tetratricopeptide (TPR) repeat protein